MTHWYTEPVHGFVLNKEFLFQEFITSNLFEDFVNEKVYFAESINHKNMVFDGTTIYLLLLPQTGIKRKIVINKNMISLVSFKAKDERHISIVNWAKQII